MVRRSHNGAYRKATQPGLGTTWNRQLSSGGGQFIDVHTGKTGRESFRLDVNRSGVSDIRVVCRTGGIKVADIEMTK